LKYTVANFNSSSVSARPLLRFYQSDGSGGTPGTLILALTVNPMTFAPNSVAVFTANLLPGQLVVPTSFFWAGITFDDNFGTTGATLAQLNNLGQGIYNPPTVGSSDDQFFATSSAGSFASNNPPGGMFNFGGNPLANL